MSKNLIAYIPTLNKRHKKWLDAHRGPDTNLFLISQRDAESLLPRLARNEAALPTGVMVTMLRAHFTRIGRISSFSENWVGAYPDLASPDFKDWILADEDVSHLFAEKHLIPAGCNVQYEMIWARYDMQAVHAMQPVMEDFPISSSDFDREVMGKLKVQVGKSPDWWRQIAAMAVTVDGHIVVAHNTHLPTEYETYIFGDPRLNVDAGQKGKYCSIHAEELVTTLCARHGYKLEGGTFYVTTFPCEGCARVIKESGAKLLYFADGYSSLNAQEVLRGKVEIIRVN